MRHTLLASVAGLALACSAQAQTIDLSQWTIEQFNGTGTWTIDPVKRYCNFMNSVNTDCSVLVSDFQVNSIEFRMSVQAVGDDDVIGFLLGYQPGDYTNAQADYLMVDWKKITQSYQDWGTSNAGLAISRVQGAPKIGYGGGPIDFWSHTGVVKELARGNRFGSTGWDFNTNYLFKVLFTPAFVEISVNGVPEFRVMGPFKPGGRFACYNYSQSGHEFQFPIPGAYKSFGKGCSGSAGTPYLFAPSLPIIGENFPVIVANLPSTAPVLLMLGVSNQSWGSVPLPLDLSAAGATGCSLLVSPDVFSVIQNFNGTAYTTFPLPNDLIPGTKLYLQAGVVDLGANALGLTFSNGGEATIGVR